MIPRPGQGVAPGLPTLRGHRHCDRCGKVTPHTAVRRLAPAGRALIVVAIAITVALYVHNWLRFHAGNVGFAVLYWALPAGVGLVLLAIALRRRGYRVECRECRHASFRLSPPRWTRAGSGEETRP